MIAFRPSVEAMIPALRRYARALTRDTDIADDLVQDTLVRALALGAAVSRRRYPQLALHHPHQSQPQSPPLAGAAADDLAAQRARRGRRQRHRGGGPRHRARARRPRRGAALGAAAGDAGGTDLSRGGGHPGRADRHGDVAPGAGTGAHQGFFGGRAPGATPSKMR